ncbi:MAG: hypothetical protein IH830_13710 [Planctomycetes bacterium]|nr:hypothetical protein [Planctomycetota bacterium]
MHVRQLPGVCAAAVLAGVASIEFTGAAVALGDSQPLATPAVEIVATQIDSAVITLNRDALSEAVSSRATFTIKHFPLSAQATVDLEVQRFRVTGADTIFVVGRGGGDDAFDFDPDRITLLRGHVAGYPNSHVFLALSDWGSTGSIDLGEAGRRYVLSPYHEGVDPSGAFQLRIWRNPHPGGPSPEVPLCGVPSPGDIELPGGIAGTLSIELQVTQQIELAIETDYEFFQLFGDLDTAAAYVVQLYAALSDIFLRDVNTRVKLSFVRLWDTPDDLFNEPDPLFAFRDYWNKNMTEVHRDVAQFLSGRRDLPYGGVAYLSALCSPNAYSVVGYALGFFSNATAAGVYQYDLIVTAHELGHNCGTLHTHDYLIDTCNDLDGTPQRGTIMSYCSQTVSGGNANIDLRFHAVPQQFMSDHIFEVECIADDCNGNGIDDALDIAHGDSSDLNANGIPDECEDCNDNGVLDDLDIALGTSLDLNGNGIPDECEPDCNGNNVPDDLDILNGDSTDLYGNSIPDECEQDCNGDGVSDYTEIQANMSLDIDRDAVLDACQDCDGDGLSDLDALGGAHNAWVASLTPSGSVSEFHALTGVLVKATAVRIVDGSQDVVISSTGRIFVSSANDDRIVEFNGDGIYVGDFVAAGRGGLDYPTGMVIAPNGNLLVCSRETNSVLEYDGATGDYIRTVVEPGAGGLTQPFGITFGPDGNLFVTSSDNRIIEYNGRTGALVGDFVSASDTGGLEDPHGIVFKPDGNLLVASFLTNEILEYDGDTGAFLGRFNHGGTETALTLDQPWCLRIGRDGRVYVSRNGAGEPGGDGGASRSREHSDIQNLHINSTRIYVFDADSGNFIRSYVLGNDTDLALPTGFDFMPGSHVDCNFNQIPDSCDIDRGASRDNNGNGVPDECECPSDLDGDGSVGILDLLALLAAWGTDPGGPPDFDSDGTVGIVDLLTLLANWGPCP